jgi:hypothetical protein
MSKSQAAAAPETATPDFPSFEDLESDPEIAALLDFEPARRKMSRPDGWTPELQRELIARIADCGSPGVAADQMRKNPSGAKHLYRTEGAEGFRAAWKAAMALAKDRERAKRAAAPARPVEVPGMARRSRKADAVPALLPGQVYNELGQPEDEASLKRRGEDARFSIAGKLLGCRRWYLREIAGSPGKRAAFEILTELPIDWDRAERMEPQDDEPYRTSNQREPDMILTAENGWFNSIAPYGPDKIAALRRAIDEHRAKRGQPPVNWDEPDRGPFLS